MPVYVYDQHCGVIEHTNTHAHVPVYVVLGRGVLRARVRGPPTTAAGVLLTARGRATPDAAAIAATVVTARSRAGLLVRAAATTDADGISA
jgi:hypothetical protein